MTAIFLTVMGLCAYMADPSGPWNHHLHNITLRFIHSFTHSLSLSITIFLPVLLSLILLIKESLKEQHFSQMPSNRKQTAKEKPTRQSNALSDLENTDVMLCNYSRNEYVNSDVDR